MDTTRTLKIRFESRSDANPLFRRSFELIQLILEAGRTHLEANGLCLYEMADEGRTLVLRASRPPDEQLRIADVELSASAAAWLLRLEDPELIRSADADGRVSDYPEVLLHRSRELLVAPLRSDGQLRGILTVGWREAGVARETAAIPQLVRSLNALLDRSRELRAA